eukprot:TRINITY_DN19271_c0_g1_i2.p1 TRINITY_DN19271_c0_g1~~TRINITY_DN19271_c0_g1_i2.p1  ORF type:complete len:309 (-),score=48.11 TRINITY_DN19271_c0_g1_i2:262-1188(-)
MTLHIRECAQSQVGESVDEEVIVVRNTFLDVSRPRPQLRRAKSWNEPLTPGVSRAPVEEQQHDMQLLAHLNEVWRASDSSDETSYESSDETQTGKLETPCDLGTHKQDEFADSHCGRLNSTAGRRFQEMQPAQYLQSEDEDDEGNMDTPHSLGTCTPCKFAKSSKGCRRGTDCEFCHLSHHKRKRARPSKGARQRCREMHRLLEEVFGNNPEQKAMITAEIASRNDYFRRLSSWSPEEVSTRSSTRDSSDGGAVYTEFKTLSVGTTSMGSRQKSFSLSSTISARSNLGAVDEDLVARSWPLNSWSQRM